MEPYDDEILEAQRPQRSFLSEFPKPAAFIPALLLALLATGVSIACWVSPQIHESLVGRPREIFQFGDYYRLVSSIFVHSNMKHLLGNMLFFVPFGGLLTYYFGWRMFPVYALGLGIFTQYLSLKTYPPDNGLQGASGMLYVMFGLWLALYYKAETHIPSRKRWLRIIGFCLVMMIPSEFSPQVSYRTHLIGLAIGLIAGILYGVLNHENFEQRNQELARRELMGNQDSPRS